MNPILKLHKTISYAEMGRRTDMLQNTMENLAKLNRNQLKRIYLGTVVALKDKLGVDMVEYMMKK